MGMRKRMSPREKQFLKNPYLGCPLTRNRTPWCFRLCHPNAAGEGRCGRVAPHALRGRTQICIEHFKKRGSEPEKPQGSQGEDK